MVFGKQSLEDGIMVYRHYRLSGSTHQSCHFHGASLTNCTLINCKVFHCHLIDCRLINVSMFQSTGIRITVDEDCTISRAPMNLKRLATLDAFQRNQISDCLFKYLLMPECFIFGMLTVENKARFFKSLKTVPPFLAAARVGCQNFYRDVLLAYYKSRPFILDESTISSCRLLSVEALKHIRQVIVTCSLATTTPIGRMITLPDCLVGLDSVKGVGAVCGSLDDLVHLAHVVLRSWRNLRYVRFERPLSDLDENKDAREPLRKAVVTGTRIFEQKPRLGRTNIAVFMGWTAPEGQTFRSAVDKHGMIALQRATQILEENMEKQKHSEVDLPVRKVSPILGEKREILKHGKMDVTTLQKARQYLEGQMEKEKRGEIGMIGVEGTIELLKQMEEDGGELPNLDGRDPQ